jgi:hypothetical protein
VSTHDARQVGGDFCTVGQLRRLLEGVPDDRFLACQVVAADGSAWNMGATFTPQVPHGTIAALTLAHPELHTLCGAADRPAGRDTLSTESDR